MNITVSQVGKSTVIKLDGDFISEVDQLAFRDRVHDLAKQGKIDLIIDLSSVKHMNSCGLGSLICALTTVRKSGGDLHVTAVGPEVAEIFRITRLDAVLRTHADV